MSSQSFFKRANPAFSPTKQTHRFGLKYQRSQDHSKADGKQQDGRDQKYHKKGHHQNYVLAENAEMLLSINNNKMQH